MKGHHHLLISAFLLIVGSVMIYSFTGWSIFGESIIHILIAFYVFTNLPDIDSSTSIISKSFYAVYIGLAVYGLWRFVTEGSDFSYFMVAGVLALYHVKVADDSKNHRKFPHSFTFGIAASLAHWYLTSFPIAVFGFVCFVLHLAVDMHVLAALRTDARFWGGLLRGRISTG
jgi:hypothetical protein